MSWIPVKLHLNKNDLIGDEEKAVEARRLMWEILDLLEELSRTMRTRGVGNAHTLTHNADPSGIKEMRSAAEIWNDVLETLEPHCYSCGKLMPLLPSEREHGGCDAAERCHENCDDPDEWKWESRCGDENGP